MDILAHKVSLARQQQLVIQVVQVPKLDTLALQVLLAAMDILDQQVFQSETLMVANLIQSMVELPVLMPAA
jgi:hypothetical protein